MQKCFMEVETFGPGNVFQDSISLVEIFSSGNKLIIFQLLGSGKKATFVLQVIQQHKK
jgi:hypothetical protein